MRCTNRHFTYLLTYLLYLEIGLRFRSGLIIIIIIIIIVLY